VIVGMPNLVLGFMLFTGCGSVVHFMVLAVCGVRMRLGVRRPLESVYKMSGGIGRVKASLAKRRTRLSSSHGAMNDSDANEQGC
jgi:hypothetical protein